MELAMILSLISIALNFLTIWIQTKENTNQTYKNNNNTY